MLVGFSTVRGQPRRQIRYGAELYKSWDTARLTKLYVKLTDQLACLAVCIDFTGNFAQNSKPLYEQLLNVYDVMWCKIILQIRFFNLHQDSFPPIKTRGSFQDETFTTDKRSWGQCRAGLWADYYYKLARNASKANSQKLHFWRNKHVNSTFTLLA